MNTQTTIERLEKLKLKGMSSVYQAVTTLPIDQQPSLDALIARMVDAEMQERVDRRTALYLKTSKLRYNATMEEIHCSVERNINKEQLMDLAECRFIKRGENLLVTGSTGCGKSFLACAVGKQACYMGYRTLYLPMSRFVERMAQSKIDGSFIKLINNIERHDLIILDDFGLQPLDSTTRLALLQILEDRFERKSVIVTSQLPVSAWYEYIGEPTLADAIMDRLISGAKRIELKGASMRVKNQK
ncbi:MAG: IS21-like element helper ATPase IstB [Rikenellaceae bacterium]